MLVQSSYNPQSHQATPGDAEQTRQKLATEGGVHNTQKHLVHSHSSRAGGLCREPGWGGVTSTLRTALAGTSRRRFPSSSRAVLQGLERIARGTGVTEGWAAPPHWGGISPVGVALDIATRGPPSYHLGLQLALGATVNTHVRRTASATVSPSRDINSDIDGVSSCPAIATAAAAAEGGACAVPSARHVGHRVHGHTMAAVLRRPRPDSNATPKGRLAAYWARALHVSSLHRTDGVVVRTVASCARFPQDFDLTSIGAAGRPGGVHTPRRSGMKWGLVYAMTPVRVTFTVLTMGGPHPQIKACGHGISSRVILQRALSPLKGCLRILLRPYPRPYEMRTCFSGSDRLRSALLSL
jgi:hypothetical protein